MYCSLFMPVSHNGTRTDTVIHVWRSKVKVITRSSSSRIKVMLSAWPKIVIDFNFNFMHVCFAFAINFVNLPFILYHASCVCQLLFCKIYDYNHEQSWCNFVTLRHIQSIYPSKTCARLVSPWCYYCISAPLSRSCHYLTFLLTNCVWKKLSAIVDNDMLICRFLANVNSTFTFAICRRPSVRLSVVCLSVFNVRAPYSGDWNFRQCFYTIWYAGHQLTSR